jgi:hypothetical protein
MAGKIVFVRTTRRSDLMLLDIRSGDVRRLLSTARASLSYMTNPSWEPLPAG